MQIYSLEVLAHVHGDVGGHLTGCRLDKPLGLATCTMACGERQCANAEDTALAPPPHLPVEPFLSFYVYLP